MTGFRAERIEHEYTQRNQAAPERVFPLLCPVHEADWVPGWEYRLIYTRSGVAELGCVFTTPNPDGRDSVWIVTDYDPAAYRINFCWVWPEMVATRLEIQLRPVGRETDAHIRYTYTGLSEAGNAEVRRYDRAWFLAKMNGWEKAINHYLTTGKLITAGAWE
jgi:hypothetical protein